MVMGRLARARGVLVEMMLLKPILLGDALLVLAGALGQAVIRWEGDRPGYFVEWEGHAACAVLLADEGRVWARVRAGAGNCVVQ